MKKTILSGLALLGLSTAQASILSCPCAESYYASGVTASAGFSLQTRSGHFSQSSYPHLDGDDYTMFFFLDFDQDLQPPFDSYAHDFHGIIEDSGVGYFPGEPSEHDYAAAIAGLEQFGLGGLTIDYVTSFSVDLHFVYDGENWTGSGTWEYYSAPLDESIACPQTAVPESGPGAASLAVLFGGLALGAQQCAKRRDKRDRQLGAKRRIRRTA